MNPPAVPSDEATRLAKLNLLGIIYSPAEERFDRITSMACTVFGVPIALVSLVSEKCQWFKSAQGLTAAETSREISFCGHAILQDDTFVVPDASQHPDFADNPLVTGEPFIRFYAGHPLLYQGSAIGTLCLIDHKPRQLTPSELDSLRSLAAWAENELKTTALSEAQTQLLKELDESKRNRLLDPLTKVWNRSGMDKVMVGEMDRARSTQQRVALMLLEVDRYEDITKRHGSPAGDVVLQEVAKRIRSSVSASNVIVRYTEDRFLLFVADCREQTAKILAERILARVKADPIQAGKTKILVSLTIGVASAYAAGKLDTKALTDMGEAALAEANAAGGNCIRYNVKDWKPGGR